MLDEVKQVEGVPTRPSLGNDHGLQLEDRVQVGDRYVAVHEGFRAGEDIEFLGAIRTEKRHLGAVDHPVLMDIVDVLALVVEGLPSDKAGDQFGLIRSSEAGEDAGDQFSIEFRSELNEVEIFTDAVSDLQGHRGATDQEMITKLHYPVRAGEDALRGLRQRVQVHLEFP